jgi:hypothetical protein
MAHRRRRPTSGGHRIPARLSWTEYQELVSGPNPRVGEYVHFPDLEHRMAVYAHHVAKEGDERLGLNLCCRPVAWFEARGLDRFDIPDPKGDWPENYPREIAWLYEAGELDAEEVRYAMDRKSRLESRNEQLRELHRLRNG